MYIKGNCGGRDDCCIPTELTSSIAQMVERFELVDASLR